MMNQYGIRSLHIDPIYITITYIICMYTKYNMYTRCRENNRSLMDVPFIKHDIHILTFVKVFKRYILRVYEYIAIKQWYI